MVCENEDMLVVEDFQYQLFKHTLKSARAGAASPGAWGGWRRSAPSCPSATAGAAPPLQPGTIGHGVFSVTYGWFLQTGSLTPLLCSLHLFPSPVFSAADAEGDSDSKSRTPLIYGHGVFLTGIFILPLYFLSCVLFRCALGHAEDQDRHCWWDSFSIRSFLIKTDSFWVFLE